MDNLDIDGQMYHSLQSRNQQDDTYYHEYIRLYLANIALTAQVKELIIEKNSIANRLSKYQDDQGYSAYEKNQQKNKRFRRTAHEIERFYKCIVKTCEKSYGSEGSLNQHYKLKHPEIYVTLPNVFPTKSERYNDNSEQNSEFHQLPSKNINDFQQVEHDKENSKLNHHNICQKTVHLAQPKAIWKKPTSAPSEQCAQKTRTSTRVRKSSFLDNLKENYY